MGPIASTLIAIFAVCMGGVMLDTMDEVELLTRNWRLPIIR